MFKILNGYENVDSNIFFEIKQSKITRGHNFTLVKKQSRLDVRKFSFSQRTINVWNKLSNTSSVNMFKNKIDKYLVNPIRPGPCKIGRPRPINVFHDGILSCQPIFMKNVRK